MGEPKPAFSGASVKCLSGEFMQDKLRELLAEYAHTAWAGWMAYLFSKCVKLPDGGYYMPAWAAQRWERQVATAYSELPEGERASDREEADKMLGLMYAEEL